MLDAMLLSKKASVPGLSMALDFEDVAVKDSVTPTRTFSNAGTGGGLVLSTTQAKNGTKSLFQTQVPTSASTYLTTALTPDLKFTGDFWMEAWGYCLGQGNTLYTGGYNTIISFGSFSASGGVWRWHLDNLKLALRTPSGTTDAAFLTGNIAVTNNSWNHFALGRSGSTTYLFVNGAAAGSSTAALGVIGFGGNLNIAGYYDNRLSGSTYAGFNGYLDRIRIYNYCLYTSAFTPGTGLYPN